MATDDIPPPDEDETAEGAPQDTTASYDTGDGETPSEPAIPPARFRDDVNEGDALEQAQEVPLDEDDRED